MFSIYKQNKGFTILEVVVSISLFVLIIILANSMFTLSQKAFNSGSMENELSQNARVVLDRISREMRQSQEITTALPTSESNGAVELFFQDGHDTSQITYIRYSQDGTDLIRTHEAYYFPADPSTYVIWNAIDAFGNTTTKTILDSNENIIGEYFYTIKFWGEKSLIYISITLQKGVKTLKVNTSVSGRNL